MLLHLWLYLLQSSNYFTLLWSVNFLASNRSTDWFHPPQNGHDSYNRLTETQSAALPPLLHSPQLLASKPKSIAPPSPFVSRQSRPQEIMRVVEILHHLSFPFFHLEVKRVTIESMSSHLGSWISSANLEPRELKLLISDLDLNSIGTTWNWIHSSLNVESP